MWDTIIIQPMTNLLVLIYDLLGSGPNMFGLAIILFTIRYQSNYLAIECITGKRRTGHAGVTER